MSIYYDKNGLPIDIQPQQQAWNQPQPQFAAPMPVMNPMMPVGPVQQRSVVAAALLCFFFGVFGAHNFYLGHTNRGVVMLILSVVALFTSFFLIGFLIWGAMLVWELVDLIMILTKSGPFARDGRGVPLA